MNVNTMLPEVGRLVNFKYHKYQYGEDPTVRTATQMIWWDEIMQNLRVIEWEAAV